MAPGIEADSAQTDNMPLLFKVELKYDEPSTEGMVVVNKNLFGRMMPRSEMAARALRISNGLDTAYNPFGVCPDLFL